MDKILIENGDVFDGDWDQLNDCFGISEQFELEIFCMFHSWSFTITEVEGD